VFWVWACLSPIVFWPSISEVSRLGFRGVQNFRVKLSRGVPPCIIPPGKQRCRVIKYRLLRGFLRHQGLSSCGLRRRDLHHVACWIRSSSSGDVLHVVGSFLSG
jgi:hypothetical protein